MCKAHPMQVHLVDGTYELFRHYYARPEHVDADGIEVGAVRGVVDLGARPARGAARPTWAWPPITWSSRSATTCGTGTRPARGSTRCSSPSSPSLEEALRALGVAVWPEVELEADDALASALHGRRGRRTGGAGAHLHARQGPRPVRAATRWWCSGTAATTSCYDEAGVRGEVRRAARVDPRLARARRGQRRRLPRPARVGSQVGGHACSPATGRSTRSPTRPGTSPSAARPSSRRPWPRPGAAARLFRTLATLRTDGEVGDVDDWRWTGPTPEFPAWADRLGSTRLAERAATLSTTRAG